MVLLFMFAYCEKYSLYCVWLYIYFTEQLSGFKSCLLFVCSRVVKSDMELEVLRYTNRISSDAHKMVSSFLIGSAQCKDTKEVGEFRALNTLSIKSCLEFKTV